MSELIDKIVASIVVAEETARKIKPRQKGHTHSLSILVDKLTVVDFVNNEPHARLFALTICNDGDSEVYASINEHKRGAPLKPHETLSVRFDDAVIEKLYLDVDEGKSAVVRVFGTY
jgi:hypothetical protein